MAVTEKPLGRKAYGSIPHLPKSRIGPGDHFITEGQQTILTEKARDRHDRIIVTEKLDGSCVSVARVGGEIVALGRAGYLAASAPYDHIQDFAVWVKQNVDLFADLPDGERLCGEWITMAHGTIYEPLEVPFVVFDLMRGETRLPHDEMVEVAKACGLDNAHVISDGPPLSVEQALAAIADGGFHGAKDGVEGCVWRVERRGQFDFIAKFVRHDKQDGKYFAQITGADPIWFWRPGKAA